MVFIGDQTRSGYWLDLLCWGERRYAMGSYGSIQARPRIKEVGSLTGFYGSLL